MEYSNQVAQEELKHNDTYDAQRAKLPFDSIVDGQNPECPYITATVDSWTSSVPSVTKDFVQSYYLF